MKVINILIYIAMFAVCACFFAIVYSTCNKLYVKKDDIFYEINKKYSSSKDYSSNKLKLSRLGIMYRTKNYNLTPGYYLILRIGIGLGVGLLGMLLFSKAKLLVLIGGFLIGFFGTHFYFVHENNVDNEEMIMDIYNTYANLKIQMTAGIYIRECLEYTYEMVTNERYKEALAELILNFSDKTVHSVEAVKIFKNRFNSSEIDKLSALITSFLQYGLNSNHAEDIMSEIQGIIQASTLKTENDIEMKTGIINFAFFAIIIVMVVYIIFSSFSLGGLF